MTLTIELPPEVEARYAAEAQAGCSVTQLSDLQAEQTRHKAEKPGWDVKRVGNLWPQLTSWENLVESARAAARGKRKRPEVARFLHELAPNLCRLQLELGEGTYRPGVYRERQLGRVSPRRPPSLEFESGIKFLACRRRILDRIEGRSRKFAPSIYLTMNHFPEIISGSQPSGPNQCF